MEQVLWVSFLSFFPFFSFLSFLSSFLPFLSFPFTMSTHILSSSVYKSFMASISTVPAEERTEDLLADKIADALGNADVCPEEFIHAVFVEVCHFGNWPSADKSKVADFDAPLREDGFINDVLFGYAVPDLSVLANLWRNFPVVGRQIPGTQDYVIEWHKTNLTAWRETRAESHDEFEDYQAWCEERLFHSLGYYADFYDVFNGRDEDEICIIRAKSVPAQRKSARAIDVLKSHPVAWNRDADDSRVHIIELNRMKAKVSRDADSAVVERATAEVRSALLADLSACSDCSVTMSAEARVLCVVTIDEAFASAPKVEKAEKAEKAENAENVMPVSVSVTNVTNVSVNVSVTFAPAPVPVVVPAPVAVPVAVVVKRAGRKALDVLKTSLVAWERNGAVHTIKLHRAKAGVPRNACAKAKTAEVRAKLLADLADCDDCSVEHSANPDILCVVIMKF